MERPMCVDTDAVLVCAYKQYRSWIDSITQLAESWPCVGWG